MQAPFVSKMNGSSLFLFDNERAFIFLDLKLNEWAFIFLYKHKTLTE